MFVGEGLGGFLPVSPRPFRRWIAVASEGNTTGIRNEEAIGGFLPNPHRQFIIEKGLRGLLPNPRNLTTRQIAASFKENATAIFVENRLGGFSGDQIDHFMERTLICLKKTRPGPSIQRVMCLSIKGI